MENLKDYIKERKAVNGYKFYDHSLWPFLDEHKGKRLKNIKSKDLKLFLDSNDFDKKENWSEHANQYNITVLGKLLSYIKSRLKRENSRKRGEHVKGLIWINDGENHRRIKPDEAIPEGWVKGLSKKYKEDISKGVKKYNEKTH